MNFFKILESAACTGNWSEKDMIRIAVLKLTDVARAFYNGTLELHDQNIMWTAFKAAFHNRFRDVRTDQYHFTQLQMARQKKDESPQEFAHRCRSLGQKTVPQVEDPVTQKLYHEQAEIMLLASFTSGLLGTPGSQVRFAMLRTMGEALKIAITVNQAEIQERHNKAFYLDEACGSSTADRPRGTWCNGTMRNTTQHTGPGCIQSQYHKGPSRNSGNGDDRKCYKCGGIGHFEWECPTCQNHLNSRNHASIRGGNAPQGSAGTLSQEVLRRPKGQKND